ncbi:MAG: asparaginase [Desulfonatronovibrionaceae bacterium]
MHNKGLLSPLVCLFFTAAIGIGMFSTALAGSETPAKKVLHKLKNSTPKTSTVGSNPDLPTVAIISTGGTIAEKTKSKNKGAVPSVSGSELVAAVKGLDKIANIKVVNFCNIDSSQMEPEIWAELSKEVDKILKDPDIKGAVITHGTDTMAIGAYMLDITLNTDKPVVFTGAMNDASSLDPDGPANILHAVQQVCSENAENWGVTVTLNRYVSSAKNVRKTHTTNPQTFKCGPAGYLGYVFNGRVIRYNERGPRRHLPVPDKLPQVTYVATYSGANGELIRHAVDNGAKGLVVDGLGAGNVNAATFEAVKYALDQGVAVIISTRVYHGGFQPIYGDQGGGQTLVDQGCLMAPVQLTGPKCRILLMLALGNYGNDSERLNRIFAR